MSAACSRAATSSTPASVWAVWLSSTTARTPCSAVALSHPNIVAIYDVGEDDGAPFMVMEFVAGESLRQRLQREERLPARDIEAIGAQIADALGAAHRRGLIHRDVKPGNI